jgi:hypothetical protein
MKISLLGQVNGFIIKDSSCVLVISIDPYYSAEKSSHFEGKTFDEICKSLDTTFKSITIVIADSLQRYTLMAHGESEENATQIAVERGKQWLERNKPQQKLQRLKNIISWDQFLKNEDYLRLLDIFSKRYLAGETLKKELKNAETSGELDAANIGWLDAVNKSAGYFVGRCKHRAELAKKDFDDKRALTLSKQYAIEEGVVTYLWKDCGWHFHLYPGKLNDSISYILHNYVKSEKHTLLPLEIKVEPDKKETLVISSNSKEQQPTAVTSPLNPPLPAINSYGNQGFFNAPPANTAYLTNTSLRGLSTSDGERSQLIGMHANHVSKVSHELLCHAIKENPLSIYTEILDAVYARLKFTPPSQVFSVDVITAITHIAKILHETITHLAGIIPFSVNHDNYTDLLDMVYFKLRPQVMHSLPIMSANSYSPPLNSLLLTPGTGTSPPKTSPTSSDTPSGSPTFTLPAPLYKS